MSAPPASSASSVPPGAPLVPDPDRQTGAAVAQLVAVMQRLLAPDGCPWDREQTLATLVPYLIEETYEVVDALAEGTVDDHREELGDVLLQVVFHAALRESEGAFGIDDVARTIVAKLIRRHPHVFGTTLAADSRAVVANWALIKAQEKAEKADKAANAPPPSALDGVPRSAPGLLRAARLGEKAGAVGFDFSDAEGPRDKVSEELGEFDRARRDNDRDAMTAELGDLLFATVNLARKLDIDAESALRAASDRFALRFRHIESSLAADSRTVAGTSADELEQLWQQAKRATAAP